MGSNPPRKRVKRLKLAELMAARGLTANAVAKAVGVSPNTIAAYVRGAKHQKTDHSMVVNLMAYFGLSDEEDLIEYEYDPEQMSAALSPV